MISRIIYLLLATSILFMQPAAAVKIVRLQLEYGGDGLATGGFAFPKVTPTLDLELYDDITPNTVTNYLNYVNSGRYDLTFVNRSLPGFVLQTGGVTNISADPINEALGVSFGAVPSDLPIINEPGLSNLRGTIAMAKVPGNPDSATSEWFINLNDNSNLLDADNGGFTVFGSVVDNGMDIADEIASFPIADISFIFGAPYSDVPFADYNITGGEVPAFQRNLIMITSATEISRPIVHFTASNAVFGSTPLGSDISMDVVVTNTGNETLDIGTISGSMLDASFTILSETCSNTSLVPVSITAMASCSISLLFKPAAFCKSDDRLVVDYTSRISGNAFSFTYRTFSGLEDSDRDNVLSIIERAGPNSGDGNNDGIADDIQRNVTSLATCQGDYLTLVAEDALIAKSQNRQSEVNFDQVQLLSTIPAGAPFTIPGYESYRFDINFPINGITGDSTRVALYFPLQTLPSSYYRYGPTPDNTAPHWYDFSFDAATNTGAIFVGKVGITSASGAVLERNMVILNLVDGAKGDDDLIANGKIVHAVGSIDQKQSADSSGSGSAVYLWALTFILLSICRKYTDIRLRST